MYTLSIILFLAALKAVLASTCIAFDSSFNLLIFGLYGKDYNVGLQDGWSDNKNASEITTSGRPPFDGSNLTCYLSQFNNAIYALGADKQNPASVYIYDATAKVWSMQVVNPNSFDPSSSTAILDHDTNVFYALSRGGLFFLDMGMLKAANTSALSWSAVQSAPYPDNYQPVMAIAQNHIHFLNVPGVPAGSAQIFVIHFSFFQPEAQSYPGPGGTSFPATHGQTASFFRQDNTVQQEFAFIPDDGSSTYIVNVETNSTKTLAAPSVKDPNATYVAAVNSIVQLTSAGAVSYISYKPDDPNALSSAKWSPVNPLMAVAPPSNPPVTKSGGPLPTPTGATKNNAGNLSPPFSGGLGCLTGFTTMVMAFALLQ